MTFLVTSLARRSTDSELRILFGLTLSTACSIGLSYMSKSSCLSTGEQQSDHDSAIHAAQTHSEGRALVIVRVPKNDELSLTTALDAGAAGIIIPHVESAQEVKDMIKEIYYRTSSPNSTCIL